MYNAVEYVLYTVERIVDGADYDHVVEKTVIGIYEDKREAVIAISGITLKRFGTVDEDCCCRLHDFRDEFLLDTMMLGEVLWYSNLNGNEASVFICDQKQFRKSFPLLLSHGKTQLIKENLNPNPQQTTLST